MESTREPLRTIDRRRFLQLGIGGAACLLWPNHTALAKANSHYQKLLIRFRTDPERIARMLPPGLSPGKNAEVYIEYVNVTPESAGPPFASPYVTTAIRLAVQHDAKPAWFEPIRWTNHDWLRIWEREHLRRNTKHAEIDFAVEGATITASLARKGFRLNRVETLRSDQTVEQSEPPAARDTFTYGYNVDPNWRQGLNADKLGLWSIPALAAPAERTIRNCDLHSTKVEFQHPSPLDPIAEFPALEILEATYQEGATKPEALSDSRKLRFVTGISSPAFRPSSLIRYDRPHTNRRPWQPEGWPNESTAFKLSAPEIERYQSRKEVRLGPFDMLDVRLTTGGIKSDILPPPAQSGIRPALRVLVMRVEESDLSPVPFTESWLFAFGAVENTRGWFALSHVASDDADLTFGREVYGYPSKTGSSELAVSFNDFAARCVRRGREFFSAQGQLRGFPTGTSLSQLPVLGLRRTRTGPSGTPIGEIVAQPWHFQGRHFTVDRSTVQVALPEPADDSAVTDPWFEFNPVRVTAISVVTNATMQRSPGRIVAPVPNFESYYRERCDGIIPGIDPLSASTVPTFGVIREPVTRS